MASENDLEFEWDEDKADANLKKHNISFEEAKTVFADPFAITIDDPEHSVDECRFIDIGTIVRGKIIVVSYVEREGKIRLISCRIATNHERKIYEEREKY
jgi:uncharacterized protein